MGIINMSPDSFYRPYQTQDDILKTIETMINAGASILDIGGEATRNTIT
jgi:dihydropteroate synthase